MKYVVMREGRAGGNSEVCGFEIADIRDFMNGSRSDASLRSLCRYLKLMPKYREDFVEYLREIDRLDDAAQQLATLVNDDKLVSEHGKTTHQVTSIVLCSD